jgi:hypothetical protein
MEQLNGLAALATILVAFGGGMLWVNQSIKAGQKEQMAAHKEDFKEVKKEFKSVRKELKKRVSVAECDRLRSQCPCNQIMKGEKR